MESFALQQLLPKAISYYASATDDEITKHANRRIFQSILLRPRVFRDVTSCSLSATILGSNVGIPVFVSPAASARLAHPDGEAGIARACARFGALQIISHNASMRPIDIVNSLITTSDGPKPDGAGVAREAIFAWQLYVLKDIATTERILAEIKEIPQIKFIVLTLDAPFPGKREADERFKARDMRLGGGGPAQTWGTEARLTWTKTLAWLARHTDLPIVLKGLQTWEDVYIAATHFSSPPPSSSRGTPTAAMARVGGVILSNHGGRALDTTTTPMHVLLDIHRFCPQILDRAAGFEILIDGGITRGTDVVKALALGARAVGVGRAALYGLACGGEDGVARVLDILEEETITAMKFLGATSLSDLKPHHVNTSPCLPLLQSTGTARLPAVVKPNL
ncbi:hypothetical protein Micbo1qcDRAFT_187041 [Microdochium bolleyi]|uniref:FMN hydroxy acid dehydrogenase domain-containing protein n=1 Tax=Microdochium bolleyi TaxID=196109 RepID=A0A136JHS0_9PEZI|nr:hypothetical protein Micbo1qcDRAFT_187041 [Microdochium bolleyi]